MNYQEIYDDLKALQNRAFSLSKKDKAYIRKLSKDLEINFVEREKCKNCFSDQIIQLLIVVKKQLAVTDNINCDYVVIGDKDIQLKGKRINNNLITNELAEWLIRVYPYHEKYIKKI